MAIATTDVLGWWDCQEGTGSTAADSKGAHNAALAASASWTTGGPANLPNGISFPGSATSGNSVSVPFDYDFSAGCVAFWFNAASVSGTAVVVGNGNGGGEFDILLSGSTSITSRSRYGTDRDITSAISLSTRYFAVYNFASGAMELFLNGSSVGTNANTGTISDSGLNFVWGNRADLTDAGTPFNGKIFQVILFNRVLTSTEITALYNAGAGKRYSQAFGTLYTSTLTETFSLTASLIKTASRLLAEAVAFLPNLSRGIAPNIASGSNSPATTADDATVGSTAWSNTGNVTASDNTYASCSVGDNTP
jgi:hypothetical protein